MRAGARFGILFAMGVFCGVLASADITRSGEVVGTVESDDGTILPGATVKLAGETLIQREITQTTDERGAFRFLNVNPGSYTVTVTMDGFGAREVAVNVNVGRTSSVDVVLPLARTAAEVTVRGEAPLIDKTTPQFQTNYTAKELAQIPSSRNYIDVVDTAPGVDNRMAFGAGGNVDGYDRFGFGAATNEYQINGVSTSNLQFGNTWVNPNYDTIQEVQIVGPGASAEYSEFTGAVINVVTKTGTNEFHGGFTVYGTSDTFQANNSDGIIDLEQPTTKYAVQTNAYIGGPIIAEKLLFFASGAYNKSSNAPIQTEFFDEDTRPAAQLRLDYLANNSNTISAMYDYEPIKLTDQGLQPGLGEEVGYFREQHTNTGYLSWVSTWGAKTLTEFKYGGGEGYLGRIPNNTTDVSVYDGATGLTYNSTGFQRVQRNWRHEGRGSATHYVNDFLNASHEFKAGAEYEWQRSRQDLTSNQNLFLSLTPVGDLTYVSATQGYNYHVATSLRRPGVYIQDRATWDRLTVNLGFRYDNPKTIDDNTGETMLDFHNFSPRVGLSYDISGKGTTVASASYGRYYDKVPTYGPGTYAGTGTPAITGYGTVTDQVFDPHDWEAIAAFLIRPENITYTFNSTAIPVVDGTNNPFSDIVTARLEHQFTPRIAASVSYLYRHTTDYVSLVNIGNPTIYTPFDYTSDFTGRTFPIYAVTGGGPTQEGLGNLDFWFQRGHQAILELRSRPTDRSFLNASFTYEHTTGTRDNNECGVLSLCTNGVDGDPNKIDNPFFTEGRLSQNRPFNFKILGSYVLPWGITTSADFRWFSGRSYGALEYCFLIDGCNDPFYFQVLLEPKDARKQDNSVLLNLRVQKDILVGPVTASLVVDVLNATNAGIDYNTNIQNNIDAIYPRESTARGETVSAFGQAYALNIPRQTRFGLRLVF